MKSDVVYLEHILGCIETIEEFTSSGQQSFLDSRLNADSESVIDFV